ncbi:MAG: hypothetical protein ACJ74H_22070 [Thermoanaerobaculia bacterium]
MAPVLLLALLLSTNKAVALLLNDVAASSVTNGESTLAVWTNQFSDNQAAYRVFIRLLDSPFDRNAISLGSGFRPHVATNGRDYLVAWTVQSTRFHSFRRDNCVVQTVSAHGTPGVRKVLEFTEFGGLGGAGDVAWNGTHWMVAYSYGGVSLKSRVVFLDEALNVTSTIETGEGDVRLLERIGGRWWAFRQEATSVTEAIEIRDDGTIGQRFAGGKIGGRFFITEGPRPLVLVQNMSDIEAIPFDPDNGFGSRRPFLASELLFSVEPFEDGALLLVGQSTSTHIDVAFVDASGEIRRYSPVFFPEHPQYPWATLGTSRYGIDFFFCPDDGADRWATGAIDLYRYALRDVAPLDPATGELVSAVNAPNDRRRAARH